MSHINKRMSKQDNGNEDKTYLNINELEIKELINTKSLADLDFTLQQCTAVKKDGRKKKTESASDNYKTHSKFAYESYMIRNKQRYMGNFALKIIYNDFKMQIDPSETIKSIASRIKFYRTAQGLTIQELAYRCEMERSNLSRIEAGKSNLTVKTMCIICNALNITLRDLIK